MSDICDEMMERVKSLRPTVAKLSKFDPRWTKGVPITEGDYAIRCMEGDDEPEPAVVRWTGVYLGVSMDHLPLDAVQHAHDGLTDVQWLNLADKPRYASPFHFVMVEISKPTT